MSNEPNLVVSKLSQKVSSGGKTVSVEIYRLEDESSWTMEVYDEYDNSTLWNRTFQTDLEALTEAKKSILAQGISSFIGPEDGIGNGKWE